LSFSSATNKIINNTDPARTVRTTLKQRFSNVQCWQKKKKQERKKIYMFLVDLNIRKYFRLWKYGSICC